MESWFALAVDLTGEIQGRVDGRCLILPENFADPLGGLIDLKKSLIRFPLPLGITLPGLEPAAGILPDVS